MEGVNVLKKISVLVLFVVLICFSTANVLAEERFVNGRYIDTSSNTQVNVELYCRGNDYIRYQIRETGYGEFRNAQYTWVTGDIVDYVEVKGGSKYLPEAMLEKGYSPSQWSYTSWRYRINKLPLGIFSRDCAFRD